MKRPEGFDHNPPPRSPGEGRAPGEDDSVPPGRLAALKARFGSGAARRADNTAPEPNRGEPDASPADEPAARTDVRRAARTLRRAESTRRRFERSEVRRFTRRTRRRRVTVAVVGAVTAVLLGLIAVAVYSPLLALKTITIDGTARIDASALHSVVDDQIDTPLALIDFATITERFRAFPLIKSYVTETIPPDTLVIHIVERQPIGALPDGSAFTLVDPAGIVVERSEARIEGVPLIDIGSAGVDSAGFSAAVEVLLALPDSVLSRLDTITARTKDDVSLTLTGDGARIIWGSADRSDYKARVLAAALANDFPGVTEYNVSAPGQLTYR